MCLSNWLQIIFVNQVPNTLILPLILQRRVFLLKIVGAHITGANLSAFDCIERDVIKGAPVDLPTHETLKLIGFIAVANSFLITSYVGVTSDVLFVAVSFNKRLARNVKQLLRAT